MFRVNLNNIELIVFTSEEIEKYMTAVNDPRYTSPDSFFVSLGDDLYIRKELTRQNLYLAMGYKVYDFAYPQPWSDSPDAIRLFKTHSKPIEVKDPETGETTVRTWQKGDHIPALVWCYDPPEDSDRASLFGYPVFDTTVIRNMGKAIKGKAMAGAVEHLDKTWLDNLV